MIVGFTLAMLFMAVVVALCIGVLLLLNAAVNPPRFDNQADKHDAGEAVRTAMDYTRRMTAA